MHAEDGVEGRGVRVVFVIRLILSHPVVFYSRCHLAFDVGLFTGIRDGGIYVRGSDYITLDQSRECAGETGEPENLRPNII